MASQNINQYVYPNLFPQLSLESYDMSLTSDERDFNQEVVFSPYLIAQTYGNRLPFYFDINNTNSAQNLTLNYKEYNRNNIFVSENYYNPDNIDFSCVTSGQSCDIGLTGIDNGLVTGMTAETITFTNGLLPDSLKFDRMSFDRRLKLFQVTGNTSDPNIRFSGFSDRVLYEVVSKFSPFEGRYHELYGGFYQGFYRLFGYDYEIFPERMNKGWTVEMILKPRLVNEYEPTEGETTLNKIYPNNKNTFFYFGGRAENKFYHHADGTQECYTGYTRVTSGLTTLETCACCNTSVTNSRCIYVYPPRSANGVHDPHVNYGCDLCGGNKEKQTNCGCDCNSTACETCGWECQTHICPTPSPTPTQSVTPTPSPTSGLLPTITPTPSQTTGLTPTPSPTPGLTPTQTVVTDIFRGLYLNDFNTIIGNPTEEQNVYNWVQNNKINHVYCYDLTPILATLTGRNNVRNFNTTIRNYGVLKIAGIGATEKTLIGSGTTGQNSRVYYNNECTQPSQKYDILNIENEYWNYNGTSPYVNPGTNGQIRYDNGTNLDWKSQNGNVYQYGITNNIESDVYQGIIRDGKNSPPTPPFNLKVPDTTIALDLVNNSRRLLIDCYLTTAQFTSSPDAGFNHILTRLTLLGNASLSSSKVTEIVILFNAKDAFMKSYFVSNPLDSAYNTVLSSFNNNTFSGKAGVKLVGFMMFGYQQVKDILNVQQQQNLSLPPTPTPSSEVCDIIKPVCTPTCTKCETCTTCDNCTSGWTSIENTCETDPLLDANGISFRLCGDPKNPQIGVRAIVFTGQCETTGTCSNTGSTYVTGYTIVDYCSPPIYPYCLSVNPAYLEDEHWFQLDAVWERYTWLDTCDLWYRGGLGNITEKLYLEGLANNTSSLITVPYTQENGKTSEQIELVNLNSKWFDEKKYRKGRLKFYINGKLFYTIEDFEEIIPRALSTDKEKQVGVPFNVSWGGGTQGLRENLTFSSMTQPFGPYIQDPECFPINDLSGTTLNRLKTNIIIEQNFAGTFEGAISQFRMYVTPLTAPEIKHNFDLLKNTFRMFNPDCPNCENPCPPNDFTYQIIEPTTTTTTTSPITTTTTTIIPTTTTTTILTPFGLGRELSVDKRDLNYLISNKLPTPKISISERYWDDERWWGDQGNTPQCVGYAWSHWIDDGPIIHAGKRPNVNPTTLYRESQKRDQWPGENYNGTSVRGGAKYLQEIGKIKSYLWAFDVQTLMNTVLTQGPVVVGTNWYYNMFFPDRNGLIRASGRWMGGHAYVINGVNTKTQLFRIKNSWGRNWGQRGRAFISFSDMTRLIREGGEICLGTENKF